ncbi:MAG: hypothetical protein JJ975_05245 [Bacteroidia bacterium]|nr:hypothetical protein [Bacteroidia bacterium]
MGLKIFKPLFSVLFLAFISTFSYGQFGQTCVDSSAIDPFFQCNEPSFLPVCGCNGKTYRNECVAFRNGGVRLISHDGVCINDFFFADIYPNLVSDYINLYLQFADRGPATIQIRNTYGSLLLSQNFLSITSRQFSFDVNGYQPGLYYVFVISGDVFSVLKFMKY